MKKTDLRNPSFEILLIRLLEDAVFLSEVIMKILSPAVHGADNFEKIAKYENQHKRIYV